VRASAAALVAIATPQAASASGPSRLRVDAAAWPRIAVSAVLPTRSGTPPRVYENGRRVALLYASNVGHPGALVLAIDRSQSMHGPSLRTAIAIAQRLVADEAPSTRIAIFAIGATTSQLSPFSTSRRLLDQALRRIRIDRTPGTALYGGIERAAQALGSQGGKGKAVILISDGQATTSQITASAAAAVAAEDRVSVYPVAIPNGTYEPGALDTLARATHGAFFGASTRSSPTDYEAIASDIRRTWRIDYVTAGQPGDLMRLRVVQPGSRAETMKFTIPGASGSQNGISREVILFAIVASLVLVVFIDRSSRRRSNTRKGHAGPRGAATMANRRR
jgi:hypothetical protein